MPLRPRRVRPSDRLAGGGPTAVATNATSRTSPRRRTRSVSVSPTDRRAHANVPVLTSRERATVNRFDDIANHQPIRGSAIPVNPGDDHSARKLRSRSRQVLSGPAPRRRSSRGVPAAQRANAPLPRARSRRARSPARPAVAITRPTSSPLSGEQERSRRHIGALRHGPERRRPQRAVDRIERSHECRAQRHAATATRRWPRRTVAACSRRRRPRHRGRRRCVPRDLHHRQARSRIAGDARLRHSTSQGSTPPEARATTRSSRSLTAAIRRDVCRVPTTDPGTSSARRYGCSRVWSCAISEARSSNFGPLVSWLRTEGTGFGVAGRSVEADARQHPQCGDGHDACREQQPRFARHPRAILVARLHGGDRDC